MLVDSHVGVVFDHCLFDANSEIVFRVIAQRFTEESPEFHKEKKSALLTQNGFLLFIPSFGICFLLFGILT